MFWASVKIIYNFAQTFKGIFVMTFPPLPAKQMISYHALRILTKIQSMHDHVIFFTC